MWMGTIMLTSNEMMWVAGRKGGSGRTAEYESRS